MTPLNIGDEITFGPEVVEPKDGFVFKLFSMVHMEPRPRTPTYENGEPIEEIMIRWNNQMESRPCTPTYENETPKEEIVP